MTRSDTSRVRPRTCGARTCLAAGAPSAIPESRLPGPVTSVRTGHVWGQTRAVAGWGMARPHDLCRLA
jgi:hypothetical protein